MTPIILGASLAAALFGGCGPAKPSAPAGAPDETVYAVTGVVQRLDPAARKAIIRHEMIPGYMMAMTMPFQVKDTNLLAPLQPGDKITFRLRVTADESWIDQIRKAELGAPPAGSPADGSP